MTRGACQVHKPDVIKTAMSDQLDTKVEVQALFATPVAIARFPEADRANPALHATILEREAQFPTTDHSNRGGWQSSWDFADWCGEPGRRLLSFGEALAQKLTRTRAGQPTNLTWRLNAWANVNRGGHGNAFHTQGFCAEPGANAFGAILSNAAANVVGCR